MPSSSYSKYIKKKKKRKPPKSSYEEHIDKWRKNWREAGPIKFAEQVLPTPEDVPPHPKLGRIPKYLILTEDQKAFLYDMWKRTSNQIILIAGRGAGKTFIIAVYNTWRLACFDNFSMTVMGGSLDQSKKVKSYVDYWRLKVPEIGYILYKSRESGSLAAEIHTRYNSYTRYPSCSETAARGPHVTQVIVDETCVGEAKGVGGSKAVKSARGQLMSSPESLLVYTSTAHYIFGITYETWRNYRRLGWKRHRWSTGRYYDDKLWFKTDKDGNFILDESGNRVVNWDYVDSVLIKDRNPKHWKSNVWWIADEDIQNLRANSTNDEFLVESLGGISRGTGLVFSREDLRSIICDGREYTEDGSPCEYCQPYTENCPMMKKLGIHISQITQRKMGVDFGEVSPTAISVTGKYGKKVFVLYSEERTGLRVDEVLDWADKEIGKKYNIWEIFADPEERSLRESLNYRGYSTPHLWQMGGGAKKNFYVIKLKRLVEQHRLVIPSAFTSLIDSLSELAYDEKGKIRKRNDHSFDSLLYATSDYGVEEEDDLIWRTTRRDVRIW